MGEEIELFDGRRRCVNHPPTNKGQCLEGACGRSSPFHGAEFTKTDTAIGTN